METIKIVSHQQAKQLLNNKFVVVLGSSVQRSMYKDIVLLLQKDQYLSHKQLKTKGEMSFQQDSLVEGGSLKPMNNGTGYREVRQYQSDHHLVRFYFLTKIYSSYLQSVLNDFRNGLKPDVVIVNSCVWDISRYNSDWKNEYKENLQRFFQELMEVLPKNTLTIWNLTMPLGQNIRGGFLVPEIEHKALQLRQDVIQANFLSGTLANSFGVDVLDLHYYFRHSLQHCNNDGIHWNALAHRCITSLLLRHIAQAWGVVMPCPVSTEESTASNPTWKGFTKEFAEESLSSQYLSFDDDVPQPLQCKDGRETRQWSTVSAPLKRDSRWNNWCPHNGIARFTDFNSMSPEFYGPNYHWDYYDHHCHYYYHHHHHHYHYSHQQYVMRNRLSRNHFAPYPHPFSRFKHNSQYY